jgi:hypothetical protein
MVATALQISSTRQGEFGWPVQPSRFFALTVNTNQNRSKHNNDRISEGKSV